MTTDRTSFILRTYSRNLKPVRRESDPSVGTGAVLLGAFHDGTAQGRRASSFTPVRRAHSRTFHQKHRLNTTQPLCPQHLQKQAYHPHVLLHFKSSMRGLPVFLINLSKLDFELVTVAPKRLRQEDDYEFEASLDYTESSRLSTHEI